MKKNRIKNPDIIMLIIMLIANIGLLSYGFFISFNNLIFFLLLLVNITAIGSAYYINKEDSIFAGKFKDHFGD